MKGVSKMRYLKAIMVILFIVMEISKSLFNYRYSGAFKNGQYHGYGSLKSEEFGM
jgi:hypothetical protein